MLNVFATQLLGARHVPPGNRAAIISAIECRLMRSFGDHHAIDPDRFALEVDELCLLPLTQARINRFIWPTPNPLENPRVRPRD